MDARVGEMLLEQHFSPLSLAVAAREKRTRKSGRNIVEHEKLVCEACLSWLDEKAFRFPVLRWVSSCRDDELKPRRPQIVISASSGQWRGLAVTVKSPYSKLSRRQHEWLMHYESEKYLVGVVRLISEFALLCNAYLGNEPLPDKKEFPGYPELYEGACAKR